MTTIELKFLNADYLKDITETISNIPLRIGVSHLKVIAYFTILPPFLKWSNDYPLSINEVKLRSKNWVELLPKGPGDQDMDVIENEFFTIKGKAKTRQFLPNKVLDLYLGISHKLRCEIDDYVEELRVNADSNISVCYQLEVIICVPSDLSSESSQKKTPMIVSDHKFHNRHNEDSTLSDLFLANSISQDDEGVQMAREKRPARKRQLSVSKLHFVLLPKVLKAFETTEI